MAIHYFHCSDGIDLVVDRAGRDTGEGRELRPQALSVAGELMREVPDYGEWDRWSVYVYDGTGEVDIVPFLEVLAAAASAARERRRADREPRRRKVRRSSH